MYELIYDVDEETRNIREAYEGNWHDLQIYIKCLREGGCYNIEATCIDAEQEEEE